MLRRMLAATVLVALVVANVEVGFGLSRDGQVHHESAAMAASHSEVTAGPELSHGHEHLLRVGNPDRAEAEGLHEEHSDHEHGTCLDHCTHLHAPALPGHAPAPTRVGLTSIHHLTASELPYEGSFDTLFHPPRV